MAHALQIDTLAFSERLRAAGADEGLAKAIVEGITAADTSELATQSDLMRVEHALKSDIAEVEKALKSDIAEVRTEIAEVRTELKADIAEVRTEIAEVRTEISRSSNKTIIGLGSVIAVLFAINKLLEFFPMGTP